MTAHERSPLFHYYLATAADSTARRQLDPSYSTELWNPAPSRIRPAGLPLYPFGLWWLMHNAGLFANRDYGILIVRCGAEPVHRSCIFPGDLRFPFMAKEDLQIGDVWTHPDHRGRGIAKCVLSTIIGLPRFRGRRFWYVVEESNVPSIRAARDAGFSLLGRGVKHRRLGLSAMGYYSIDDLESPAPRAERSGI